MARVLLIVGIVLSMLVGAALFMLLLIGTAMGGDALTSGYAPWATAAIIAFPVVVVGALVVSTTLGFRASQAQRAQRIMSVVLSFAAVPLGFAVWLLLVVIASWAGGR